MKELQLSVRSLIFSLIKIAITVAFIGITVYLIVERTANDSGEPSPQVEQRQ